MTVPVKQMCPIKGCANMYFIFVMNLDEFVETCFHLHSFKEATLIYFDIVQQSNKKSSKAGDNVFWVLQVYCDLHLFCTFEW